MLPPFSHFHRVLGIIGLSVSGMSGADAADAKAISSIPLAKTAAQKAGPMFTRLVDKAATGIDFVSPVDLAHPRSFLYHSGTATGGVAIGDVDGDGDRKSVV